MTKMTHRVEDNKNNMVLLSQFYPPSSSIFTPPGIIQQEGEPSKAAKRRQQRKRYKNNTRDDDLCGLKKRKLTDEQAELLEMHFENEQKLESNRKDKLAAELGLDPRQVAVWFQNRRARDKTKKIEESYVNLKTEHENSVTEKTRLEAEVAILKEKLSVAEKEIKRMTEVIEGISFNNPMISQQQSSWFPLDPFAGSFSGFEYEDFFYLLQQSYISAAEWLLLHMN